MISFNFNLQNRINVKILVCRKFGDFVKTRQKYWRIFNLAVAYPVSMTLCMYAKILVVFNLAILCSIAKINYTANISTFMIISTALPAASFLDANVPLYSSSEVAFDHTHKFI